MNGERTRFDYETENISVVICDRLSVTVSQVMIATVNLSKSSPETVG
jgi:hypothetical protein